ncbi:MAG: SUMF1/EgtB/PvdO family nonheme iron enzyme [Proteobacteria bacterium]|nr:SUMF1/EgtB/PvdO family nonheme iron enzyme [Pseudomonadota bacterium]
MSSFEDMLDQLVPGTGRSGGHTVDEAQLPMDLGLEPLGVLGRGATGTVFRAKDPVLDRIVAVKVSNPDGGSEAREMLLKEAQLTASLSHPAVLPVHRVTAAQGLLCVEYRLAPAQTLDALWTQWVRAHSTWPIERRLQLIHALCGAVGAAHERDLIHGDVHPANVGVGEAGEPYLLDWSGLHSKAGFTGHPGYAAPECLHGESASKAADVYALAAMAWELLTLRRLRPRRTDEPLGSYIARWRDTPIEAVGVHVDIDPAIDAWLASGLSTDRDDIQTWTAKLQRILTGQATRTRRAHEAERLLTGVRADMARLRDLSTRREAELRAAGVLIAKIPGHASIAQKRPGWMAKDRATALELQQEQLWMEAAEAATLASTLSGDGRAHGLLAELWWARMRRAEEQKEPIFAAVSSHRVRKWDADGPYTAMLDAPASLSLTCDHPEATAKVERYVDFERRLVPELVETLALPIDQHALPPGSYRITVSAPGRRDTPYAVLLERGALHVGHLTLFTDDAIGEGMVHVPAGSFLMGGDPKARQPLEPCEPYIIDLFIGRTCVTSRQYLAFLNDLDEETGRAHAPGEAGFFGQGATYWQYVDGVWQLPPGWDPDWPAFAVHLADIEAYCAWRSVKEGRRIRLPTEEEWEKSSRGVDGRSFPWGPGFDPTYAHMRQSKPGAPRPWKVDDYPIDESVYGLRDTAGGMREWTSSMYDEGQLVIRGGTWGDDQDDCRCACRSGIQADFRYSFVGFRVCTDEPLSA